jgi:hypothetical protein
LISPVLALGQRVVDCETQGPGNPAVFGQPLRAVDERDGTNPGPKAIHITFALRCVFELSQYYHPSYGKQRPGPNRAMLGYGMLLINYFNFVTGWFAPRNDA